jgi:hypothetical protein
MLRNISKKGIFIIIIFCVSAVIFLGYRFLAGSIKARFLESSKDFLNAEISIGQASIKFPVSLELKDIKISDSIDIQSVRIYPNPASLFAKNKLMISRINVINPVIRIGKETLAQAMAAGFSKANPSGSVRDLSLSGVLLSRIRVHNGTIIYDEEGRNELEFIDIKGGIESPGFYFSKDNSVDFSMTGFLKNRGTDFLSPAKISGKIGINNTARARLEIDDVKISSLGDVYEKYLSRVVKEGRLDIDSDISISRASLIAKCLLEGEGIILKKGPDKELKSPLLASFVVFFSFNSKLLKFKNIKGNLFKFILNRS